MKKPKKPKKMKNLLFLCYGNLNRSPTAEYLFKGHPSYYARSASVSLNPLAKNPVTKDMIDWADTIFVMEEEHKDILFEKFPKLKNKDKEIIVLNIPDIYSENNPNLVRILRHKLRDFLKGNNLKKNTKHY